jgi:hypothetical protein
MLPCKDAKVKSVAIGIAVFFISLMTLGLFIGPLACWDGWESPSIGRSGACSSHGGINHLPQTLIVLASLAFAIIAGVRLGGSKESKPLASTHDIAPPYINHMVEVPPASPVTPLRWSIAFSLKCAFWLLLVVWATAQSLIVGTWRVVRWIYMRWRESRPFP